MVILPTPGSIETEVEIVRKRVREQVSALDLKAALPAEEALIKVVSVFRELRQGATLDKKEKVKSPSSVLSTAEAISLLTGSVALAASFGSGKISDDDIAAGLQGAVVKDEEKDRMVWKEYLDNVMKKRGAEWRGLYNACRELDE